jgi:hypothetical protein
MRCAHPDEFVPQWPSDNNSVNHVRREGQCGTNSQTVMESFLRRLEKVTG